MANVFVISDTHFGHANILKFKGEDGVTPVRSFSSVEEMDETMVENWNKVVKQDDKVYHLGDVSMKEQYLPILNRLNGNKILMPGNHDIYHVDVYRKYFKKIYGYRIFRDERVILSHIPIHPDSLERWKANIHGHIHEKVFKDKRYINVCVEQINYTPIAWEDLMKRVVA